jgi:hypothetical protein
MLTLKKTIRSFLLITTLGIMSGWLSHTVRPIFYDPMLYPDDGIKFSLVMGVVITLITYNTLLFSKRSSDYFEQSSLIKNGAHSVVITLIIFFIICLTTFGLDIEGLTLYLLGFSLPNFFIPYLDSFYNKILRLQNITE